MKKLMTLIGIVIIIVGIAVFNQWYRLYHIADAHAQTLKGIRQALIDRGLRPISWEVLDKTKGEFETVPFYPPTVKKLAGESITVVGFGIPLTGGIARAHHDGYHHASMLPVPVPVLELMLGHAHPKKFRGVTEFILTPLPLECYWKEVPPLNQAMYVRTATPVEFADGAAMAVTGTFELREQEGPKFFYVLDDAQLVE
jgi:hypothetical protein